MINITYPPFLWRQATAAYDFMLLYLYLFYEHTHIVNFWYPLNYVLQRELGICVHPASDILSPWSTWHGVVPVSVSMRRLHWWYRTFFLGGLTSFSHPISNWLSTTKTLCASRSLQSNNAISRFIMVVANGQRSTKSLQLPRCQQSQILLVTTYEAKRTSISTMKFKTITLEQRTDFDRTMALTRAAVH